VAVRSETGGRAELPAGTLAQRGRLAFPGRVARRPWAQDDATASMAARLRLPHAARVAPSLRVGGLITLALLLTALLAPALAPYAPDQIGAGARLTAPSLAHPFGTDALGRDLLSRVIYGARAAVVLAGIGVGVAAFFGVGLGLAAGFFGGWPDRALSRATEVWLAFPGLLLAVIVVARLGPSLSHAALALGIAGVPGFFRLARAETLCAKAGLYVESARALGANPHRIVFRHILPNILPSLIVLATMRAGTMLLAGGGLSFVGLGAQPPAAEWGALLAQGRDAMLEAPWLAIFPGVALMVTVIGFNLLGDGLRDWTDVR
jgi:ABC-type dipeptide/oligopeptide/nickel transport system permease subunit